jgi:hypothetical protein
VWEVVDFCVGIIIEQAVKTHKSAPVVIVWEIVEFSVGIIVERVVRMHKSAPVVIVWGRRQFSVGITLETGSGYSLILVCGKLLVLVWGITIETTHQPFPVINVRGTELFSVGITLETDCRCCCYYCVERIDI